MERRTFLTSITAMCYDKKIREKATSITFKGAISPCDAIGDLGDFALFGHELTHVIQIAGAKGATRFLADYVDQFVTNRVKAKMKPADAYHCITYEMQAYAVEEAIKQVFNDPDNRSSFERYCCGVPDNKPADLRNDPTGGQLSGDLTTEYRKAFKKQTDNCNALRKKK